MRSQAARDYRPTSEFDARLLGGELAREFGRTALDGRSTRDRRGRSSKYIGLYSVALILLGAGLCWVPLAAMIVAWLD